MKRASCTEEYVLFYTARLASKCLSDNSIESFVRVDKISVVEGVEKRIKRRVGIAH